MDRLLNLLLVEDSPDDAQLILLHLDQAGVRVEYRRVDSEAAYQAALDSPPDLILSDFAMPRFNGLRALRILRDRGLDIPFILVSGTIGEDVAVDAMKEGADDYLMKDRLGRLVSAMRSALNNKSLRDEKVRAVTALRNSEERYRNIFQTVPVSIWEEDFSALHQALQELRTRGVTDFRSHIMENPEFVVRVMEMVTVLDVNQTTVDILNADDKSHMLGSIAQFVTPDDFRDEVLSFAEGNRYFEKETSGYTTDGRLIHFWMTQTFLTDADGRTIALVCFNDITESKQAEAITLRHLSELQALYENGLAINRLLNAREIGERIIETFARYLSWHHVTIRLRKDQGDELELIAFNVEGIRDDQKVEVEGKFNSIVKVGQGLSGSVAQSGVPVRTGNLRERPEFVEIYADMQSGLYMPMKSGDRVIGVISVESKEADAFSEQDERLLATLANQAAIAIENARLYQSAQEELAERKRAQERLRESETRFRSLIENSSDEVSIITPDGLLLYESPSSNPTLGYQPEEFLGVNLYQLVHPDDLGRVLSLLEELVRDRSLHPRDRFRMRHRDGQWVWVEAVGTNMLEEPAVGGIVINYHDVTERKLAEESLQESEERYRLLFETNPQPMWVYDLESLAFLAVNDAAVSHYGYLREEFLNMTILDIRPAEDHGRLLQNVAAVTGGVDHAGNWRHRRKDGSVIDVEITSHPLEFDGRKAELVLSNDITERNRAENTIKAQLERLSGLHTIDIAIKSSFNLNTTLGILLEQVVKQLQVDAACVLVINSAMSTLEYAAGYGFRSNMSKKTSVKLGESHSGRAILERRVVQIDHLSVDPYDPVRDSLLKEEGFVSYYGVPLIAKGMAIGVLEVFNRTSVRRDHDWLEFLNTIADQAAIAIDNARLFEDLRVSNIELTNAYEATIEGWSRALDLRDKETEGHTLRVTEKTLELARRMGYPQDEFLQLRYGALLHDIGKMGVPDNILLKPGKLTEEEWEIMRKHPNFAYELLAPIRYLKSAALDVPYCHHEKWDGSGYPRKLQGTQIPLAARIFAVVDVWDAITSNRPYRSAWSRGESLKYIRDESGRHFDPQVVEAFLAMIPPE
jgi:PAS domain S-box-containing protein